VPPDHANRPIRLESFRPPLANDLFLDRFATLRKNKHLTPIVTRMLPPNSVEAELEALYLKMGANPEIPKQLAGVRYYLQAVIEFCEEGWKKRIEELGGATNYRSFIDEVEDWRQKSPSSEVFLVTFNYDTLLEDAFTADPRFKRQFNSMTDYVPPYDPRPASHYKIVKPHGSVNWVHGLQTLPELDHSPWRLDELREVIIENISQLTIPDNISKAPETPATPRPVVSRPEWLYPAVTIPVEKSKSEYECPSNHIVALEKFLPSVKKVIVIGWRAAERSFFEKLIRGLSTDVRTRVVSSDYSSADKTVTHLRESGLEVN